MFNKKAALFTVAVAFAAMMTSGAFAEDLEEVASKEKTISVSGIAETTVEPDEADISLGVKVLKATAGESMKECVSLSGAICEALGDVPFDISYSLSPNYEYTVDLPQVNGYYSISTITLDDVPSEDVGQILMSAVRSGATQINSVQYNVSNYNEIYEQTMEDAIAKATAKARRLANAAGVRLGSVVSMTEASYYADSSYYATDSVYDVTAFADAEALNELTEDDFLPIRPSAVSVKAQINMTYELKKINAL